MEPPARLKWLKVDGGFKAFPIGSHLPGRYAQVWKTGGGINTDATPHCSYESWAWCVNWEGWFSRSGFAESKQLAADCATEEWWAAVDTDLPRDVDLEAAMIAARVLVRPMPNSLLGEDSDFLEKVMWHLNNICQTEIKAGTAPAPVKQMVERLSEEFFRRRASGELVEREPIARQSRARRRR